MAPSGEAKELQIVEQPRSRHARRTRRLLCAPGPIGLPTRTTAAVRLHYDRLGTKKCSRLADCIEVKGIEVDGDDEWIRQLAVAAALEPDGFADALEVDLTEPTRANISYSLERLARS